jgi:hypothetical protein
MVDTDGSAREDRDMEENENVTSAELASEIAGMVSDEIGDRLYNGNDELPELSNFTHDNAGTATFIVADGRVATVTVVISEAP